LKIDEVDSSRYSFSPKMRGHKRGNEKSSCSFNNMTMLTLSNAILSISTRARELRQGSLRRKKLTKNCGNILPPESERKIRTEEEN